MTDHLRSDFPALSGPTRALTPLAPVLGHGDGASGVDGGAGGDAGGGARVVVVMAPDEFAWLRDVLENSAHLEHLAAMLNSDLIFQEGFGPLLRDLLARGWVSRADLELWRSCRIGSGLRWVVRRQSALDAENS